MAEWLKAAVLKTASRVIVTGVRIPLPPPLFRKIHTLRTATVLPAVNTALAFVDDPDEYNHGKNQTGRFRLR
jgi:hypothetical protein